MDPQLCILPHIRIEEIVICNMVIFRHEQEAPRKLWFVDPQEIFVYARFYQARPNLMKIT